ncbi:MAG: bifunctional folylpolyglutamate synthase/dihydrofolate synthase, partial [Clostridiales bacterium]|nr:bifunctional folylpolyglutamate synthase/dihydrofolate synthase [Clostridiales bacterium]
MDYQETLRFIHSRLTFGMKPGLDRTRELCRRLGNPQDRLKMVHVAGTNGKGSVCTMLSGILQEAGYRTGLYTSPYITDFCERMQVDGAPIGHNELCRLMEQVRPVVEQMDRDGDAPTEFEVITAAAFLWFEQTGCDVVVLETGLGGRFDSTNVIGTPLASVITSISLDHTKVLGDTVEQIAFEKCGIIKPGGVTVTSAGQTQEALGVILSRAAEEQNRVHMANLSALQVRDEGLWGSEVTFGELHVRLPLAGRHQHDNMLIAVETARALNLR